MLEKYRMTESNVEIAGSARFFSSLLGLQTAFPADILNSLRRQAYEALLIRASPIALRAYPQAKSPFPQIAFSEIHGRPIVGTSHSGNHVRFIRDSVLSQDEVSTIRV